MIGAINRCSIRVLVWKSEVKDAVELNKQQQPLLLSSCLIWLVCLSLWIPLACDFKTSFWLVRTLVPHAVVSTAASRWGGHLGPFSASVAFLDTPASSHSPKTCILVKPLIGLWSVCVIAVMKVTLNWISSKENAERQRFPTVCLQLSVFMKMKSSSRLPTNRKVFRKNINVTTYCLNEEKQIWLTHVWWYTWLLSVCLCSLLSRGESFSDVSSSRGSNTSEHFY